MLLSYQKTNKPFCLAWSRFVTVCLMFIAFCFLEKELNKMNGLYLIGNVPSLQLKIMYSFLQGFGQMEKVLNAK